MSAPRSILLLLFVAESILVCGGMFWARARILNAGRHEQRQAGWDRWRDAVRAGEVGDPRAERDVPRSSEPPVQLLFRDYFWPCLGLAWLLTSALFLTLAYMAQGVWSTVIV